MKSYQFIVLQILAPAYDWAGPRMAHQQIEPRDQQQMLEIELQISKAALATIWLTLF